MYDLIAKFLAQAGGAPDTVGILLLAVISVALLIGITIYFIEHKKTTAGLHGGNLDDGMHHDSVI